MSMTISITCDGCGVEEQTSTQHDSGANEIDTVLEEGWTHSSAEDFCPDCATNDQESE